MCLSPGLERDFMVAFEQLVFHMCLLFALHTSAHGFVELTTAVLTHAACLGSKRAVENLFLSRLCRTLASP